MSSDVQILGLTPNLVGKALEAYLIGANYGAPLKGQAPGPALGGLSVSDKHSSLSQYSKFISSGTRVAIS